MDVKLVPVYQAPFLSPTRVLQEIPTRSTPCILALPQVWPSDLAPIQPTGVAPQCWEE